MELGRDSDTGGQVKYMVELARALAETKGFYRVDLLTRQISSPYVHWTYEEPIEMLKRMPGSDASADEDWCGAYIIRLPCGPKDRRVSCDDDIEDSDDHELELPIPAEPVLEKSPPDPVAPKDTDSQLSKKGTCRDRSCFG